MRQLLLLSAFTFAIGVSGFAQDHLICGTHPGSEGFELQKNRLLHNLRAAAEGTYTARTTTYVPVRFHIGAKNDGTGRLSEQNVLDQLCELNEDFAPLDIQFFLAGGNINYINNTTFYENHNATQSTIMTIQKDQRALNVYVVLNADEGGGSSGGVTLAYYNIPRDWIVITKSYVRRNDATLSHEVGHFFSLLHTFNGWECDGYNTENMNAPSISSCGFVPTERANGSNCESSGDYICDTPADYNNGIGWSGCDFTLNVLDPQGNAIDPDERNYLSYFLNCPDDEYFFSSQQEAAIIADWNSSSRNYLRLDPVPNYSEITAGPVTYTPEDDATTTYYDHVAFEWEPIPGASAYLLEIDRVSSFSISPIRLIVYGTYKIITDLDDDRRYYWRVRAFNAHSTCAPNSDITSFRTGSDIVGTTTPGFVEAFSVSPNPVSAQSHLQIQLSSEKSFIGQVELLDITGRATGIQQEYEFIASDQQLSLPLGQISSGIYLLRINTGEGFLTEKVVVTQ